MYLKMAVIKFSKGSRILEYRDDKALKSLKMNFKSGILKLDPSLFLTFSYVGYTPLDSWLNQFKTKSVYIQWD